MPVAVVLAVQVNIEILRAFVRLRRAAIINSALLKVIDEMSVKVESHDQAISELVTAIRRMMKALRGLPPSPLRSFPLAIDAVQIEALRIEDSADPPHHVFMLLVPAIGDHLQEQRVSVRPANIIGRTRILAGHTARQRQVAGRHGLGWFDDDAVLPAIAHVVVVLELTAWAELRNHSGNGNAALIAVVAGFRIAVHFLDPPVRRNDTGADMKLVCMRVVPAHDPLQIAVQARERPLIRDDHASPDKRLHVAQFNAQCDGLRSWGGGHSAAICDNRGAQRKAVESWR